MQESRSRFSYKNISVKWNIKKKKNITANIAIFYIINKLDRIFRQRD